jgi:hypothetical protein
LRTSLGFTAKPDGIIARCAKKLRQFQRTGDVLKPPLRTVLADSHVSDIAIAAILLRSLDSAFRVLWPPIAHAATFLFTAIAILDVPYCSRTLDTANRLQIMEMSKNLISALIAFTSVWLLSRWTYRVGPIRSLSQWSSHV